MLYTQARFVIRPDGEKRSTCLIGINFPKHSTLKPGVVYEIVEVMGEYVIREVGKSGVHRNYWGYDIGTLMSCMDGRHLFTAAEYKKRVKLLQAVPKGKVKRQG